MKKVKKIRLLVMVALLAFSVTACSKKGGDDSKAGNDDSTWETQVGFHEELSVDELYEKAKAEGTVTVYSMSSRINTVKDTFEAQYPGIKVVVYDMRQSEILEKFQKEYEAGIRNADVLFVKDTDGSIVNEFVSQGQLKEYLPADMVKNAPDDFKKGAYVPYFEMKQIFYNSEVYKECPMDSWWDLTRPEYKGKIILRSPIENSETMGLFLAILKHSDEMAVAYKKEFGKELVLNGTENAGYEFLKQLAGNDLIVMTSDTEIVQAVGAPGQSNPPFGIATSSKMRDAGAKKNLFMNVAEDLSPRLGIADPAYLYIADKAKNVNAAKLLIRWMGGEADGSGPGFGPFHVRGSWPSRLDVKPVDTPSLETLNLWPLDADYNYRYQDDLRNFWITIH